MHRAKNVLHAPCRKGFACTLMKKCCMHGAKKVPCMVPKRCHMHGAKKVLHAWCQKDVACIVPKRCRIHGAEKVSHALYAIRYPYPWKELRGSE